MDQLLDPIKPWLVSMGLLAALVAAGLVLHAILYAVARRVATHIRGSFDELLISHTRRPARMLLPLMLVTFTWPSLQLAADMPPIAHRLLSIAFTAVGAWLIVTVLSAMVDWVMQRYRVDVDDNLRAREIRTKAVVLKRIATVVIVFVGSALILLQVPGIENVGASLLASAGLVGIIVGVAARPTVANLLAGVQLALTQPIRIDDVVIVEGEWGRIEEIRNTFVVVRIWDLRRLVLPLSHFIEKPFQNWTRVTADLLGTVFVYVDYTTPIEDVRRELKAILDSSQLWDGKVWNLQVTDTTERTVTLRALMSSPDASTGWDLRCYVRERLIEYLQRQHPGALPRARADILAKVNTDTAQNPGGQALAPEQSAA